MFDVVEKHRGLFKILLALIALSLVTFTAHSFSQAGENYVVSIGDEPITLQSISRLMRQRNIQENAETRKEVLNALMQQKYLINGAKDFGVSASDDRVKQIITSEPVFQDNGTFSKQKYNEYLRSINISEQEFVDELKKDIYLKNVIRLFENAPVSTQQTKAIVQTYNSPRHVQTLIFKPEKYISNSPIADDELQKFYQTKQDKYKLEQAIKFDYIRIGVAELAQQQTVTDEEIKAKVDKELSAQETAQVKQQIQLEKAMRTLAVLRENMSETAFNESKDLTAVAKVANSSIQKYAEWASKDELIAAGVPEQLVTALFSDDVLVKHNNSDVIEHNGNLWVAHISDVREAKTPKLEEIKATVEKDFRLEQAIAQAKSDSEAILQKLQKGEDVAGLKWTVEEKVLPAQVQMVLSPADFDLFMASKPVDNKPAYFASRDAGVVIFRINKIEAPIENADELLQAKIQLMKIASLANQEDYLRYLQRVVKTKNGRQNINDD